MRPLGFTLNSNTGSLCIVSPSLRNQGVCSFMDLELLSLATSLISVGQECVGVQRTGSAVCQSLFYY